jgi:glucose-6-phosphate isomerase
MTSDFDAAIQQDWVDLSPAAGFVLFLDPQDCQLHTPSGFVYNHVIRRAKDMTTVLRDGHDTAPDHPMYHIFYPTKSPTIDGDPLGRYQVTYGPVVLPPGVYGGEFVKTSGHYHPSMPGTHITYPEVYTGLHGTLLLLLQRRDPRNPDTPLDCALIELRRGVTVIIPPDYAHVLINPTREVAVMAGLWNPTFKPDYNEVVAHRGLAYYMLTTPNGSYQAVENPSYKNIPPLRLPIWHEEPLFAPIDDPATPLWQHFLRHPEHYAFLTDGEAAMHQFGKWFPTP